MDRAFTSAQISRITNDWIRSPVPVDLEIKGGLRQLRARCRDQALNNDHVRRFLSLMKNNIVGPNGFTLQARFRDPDNRPDKLASQAVEDAWRRWSRYCDVSRQLSFKALCGLTLETVIKDGEIPIRFLPDDNPFGVTLQLLDAETIDVTHSAELSNGNTIVMGVELNGVRRPVAYHFLTTDIRDDTYYSYGGKKYVRLPADEILHVFMLEWVNQTRGIPWISSGLLRLKMLLGYEEAELVAARVASAKMGFFYRDQPGAEYVGEGVDDSGNKITSAEPGTFEQLPDGMKFAPWDPTHPSTAFPDFTKACLRSIAAGLGISYNTLANDLEGVNYSSLRQGALEDRINWTVVQKWFEERVLQPIYERWLSSALAMGAITVAGRPLRPERFEKYLRVEWRGPRWQWVDPQKEMESNKTAIQMRLKSRSQIIQEMGREPEDVWQEISEELKMLEALDIEPVESDKPEMEDAMEETETEDGQSEDLSSET